MKDFYSNRVCCKCGCESVELKYMGEKLYRAGVRLPDHLEARCTDCGFTWDIETKDAKPREV